MKRNVSLRHQDGLYEASYNLPSPLLCSEDTHNPEKMLPLTNVWFGFVYWRAHYILATHAYQGPLLWISRLLLTYANWVTVSDWHNKWKTADALPNAEGPSGCGALRTTHSLRIGALKHWAVFRELRHCRGMQGQVTDYYQLLCDWLPVWVTSTGPLSLSLSLYNTTTCVCVCVLLYKLVCVCVCVLNTVFNWFKPGCQYLFPQSI